MDLPNFMCVYGNFFSASAHNHENLTVKLLSNTNFLPFLYDYTFLEEARGDVHSFQTFLMGRGKNWQNHLPKYYHRKIEKHAMHTANFQTGYIPISCDHHHYCHHHCRYHHWRRHSIDVAVNFDAAGNLSHSHSHSLGVPRRSLFDYSSLFFVSYVTQQTILFFHKPQ